MILFGLAVLLVAVFGSTAAPFVHDVVSFSTTTAAASSVVYTFRLLSCCWFASGCASGGVC